MEYRTKTRIILIVGIILTTDFVNFMADNHEDERLTYATAIMSLQVDLDGAKSELEIVQDDYQDKLMTIVTTVYEREFYNMGGYSTPEGGGVTEVYEAILNTVRDYRTMLNAVDNYFDARQKYTDEIPSIWPVNYDESIRITSGFGWRLSPITHRVSFHTGVDITGEDETMIIAVADGEVITHYFPPGWYHGVQYYGHDDFGGMVRIQHTGGFQTLSGHLSKTFVHEGQMVKRGDSIGVMGNTGKSMGIHLHYEVWKDGELVNPLDYLMF